MTPAELAEVVIARLAHRGAYISYRATTGSVYIKFTDERYGSMRVADHTGKKRYAFKWNVWVSDKRILLRERDRHVIRRHYSQHHIDRLVRDIEAYRRSFPFRAKVVTRAQEKV